MPVDENAVSRRRREAAPRSPVRRHRSPPSSWPRPVGAARYPRAPGGMSQLLLQPGRTSHVAADLVTAAAQRILCSRTGRRFASRCDRFRPNLCVVGIALRRRVRLRTDVRMVAERSRDIRRREDQRDGADRQRQVCGDHVGGCIGRAALVLGGRSAAPFGPQRTRRYLRRLQRQAAPGSGTE